MQEFERRFCAQCREEIRPGEGEEYDSLPFCGPTCQREFSQKGFTFPGLDISDPSRVKPLLRNFLSLRTVRHV